jgi:hypothetical protein
MDSAGAQKGRPPRPKRRFSVRSRAEGHLNRRLFGDMRRQAAAARGKLITLLGEEPVLLKKQHLRIKQFYGASENAVKTQNWIALPVDVLLAIARKRLGLEASLYQIL